MSTTARDYADTRIKGTMCLLRSFQNVQRENSEDGIMAAIIIFYLFIKLSHPGVEELLRKGAISVAHSFSWVKSWTNPFALLTLPVPTNS